MTEQRVAELVKKYAEGTASESEAQQLMDWYRSANIEDVHWLSSGKEEKEQVRNRMLERLSTSISPAPVKRIGFSWMKVAAALILIIGISIITAYFLKNSFTSFITVENPTGKIQLISLPDSSRVWLNASTTLRYAKAFNTNREVELEGEAYFNVTHDAAHPFIVAAGGIKTTVLGTSFNIKAYQSIQVTSVSLVTGSVRISDDTKELAVLSPAMQLLYDRKNKMASESNFDSSTVLAWTHAQLRFNGETFAEVANTLENWYGVKIVFENEKMKQCRYYMTFDNNISLEKLLSFMAEITEMKYVFDNGSNTITISGKECN